MVHWKNFIMRGFSLMGEFIIGGSSVFPIISEKLLTKKFAQIFVRRWN